MLCLSSKDAAAALRSVLTVSDRIESSPLPATRPRSEGLQRADGDKLLTSRPGQWIDRFGRPRDKPPIRRILVLKVDHIGDLLIADEAFSILKLSFPDARLELICGSWNVNLARKLGWFDAVYGVNFFHELSELQGDPTVAAGLATKGLQELEHLNLGSYDLAIDLRYDHDTRHILRSIDARIRAGYGNSARFPYLDIILPWYEAPRVSGSNELHLMGSEISPVGPIAPSITPPKLVEGKAMFSARLREVWLELEIDGARSPKDCGVSRDERLLGVGLESVAIHVTDLPGTIKAIPMFGAGWGAREDWGTWTIKTHAYLAIPIPPQIVGTEIRIDLALRGHVNRGNPMVRCAVRNPGEERTHPALSQIEFRPGSKKQTASLSVSLTPSCLRLASKPFALVPGRYYGELCLYSPEPLSSEAEIRLNPARVERSGDSAAESKSGKGSKRCYQDQPRFVGRVCWRGPLPGI